MPDAEREPQTEKDLHFHKYFLCFIQSFKILCSRWKKTYIIKYEREKKSERKERERWILINDALKFRQSENILPKINFLVSDETERWIFEGRNHWPKQWCLFKIFYSMFILMNQYFLVYAVLVDTWIKLPIFLSNYVNFITKFKQ